jgi:hypothetical protein
MNLFNFTKPLVISVGLCFANPLLAVAEEMPTQASMPGMAGLVGAQNFVWKNLNWNVDLNETHDKIKAEISFDKAEGNLSGAMFKIDPFSLKSDLARYKPDSMLWLGKASLMAKGISVNTPQVQDFVLSGLGVEFSATPSDKVFNTHLSIKYDAISGAGLAAGAADYLQGPFQLEMSANNLDLASYDNFMKSMQTEGSAALIILAKTGGEISLDSLKLTSPEGVISAQGKLVIPANPSVKDISEDRISLIKGISLDVSFSAPVTWVKKLSQGSGDISKQLDGFVKQEMISQKGDNYAVHATMKKGVIYFNDQPFINLLTILTAVPQ